MKTCQIRSYFLNLTLPFMAALLLSSGRATAQIALHDGGTNVYWVSANNETISVTNTAGANVLVVLLENRGTGAAIPASLTWNGITLTNAIQEQHSATTQRGEAIYYAYNPPIGTNNLAVTDTGAGTLALTSFTLSGVNTDVPPIVGGANTGSSGGEALVPFTIAGVPSNSWAVVNLTTSGNGAIYTMVATNATTTNYVTAGYYNDAGNGNVQQAGYVGPLPAGSITFATTNNAQYADKDNYEAVVFAPQGAAVPPVTVFSIVPNPATPDLNQNVTITANLIYNTADSPGTVTLNASALNPADSAVTMTQSSYNAGTGAAVYTATVTVSPTTAFGAATVTVVATDTASDSATNSTVVTVTAATQTWNGADFTARGIGNWSDATNWVSGVAPEATFDNVTFAGTNGLNNTNDFATSVGSITFSTGAGAFNLYGNALNIVGNAIETDTSTTPETISIATTWPSSNNVTLQTGTGATVTFAGNVTFITTAAGEGQANFPAGATGSPAVTQFGGTFNLSVPADVEDTLGFGGITMRNNTTFNLLPGAVMNASGGCFYVGQNTGVTTATPLQEATLNVESGATLNISNNMNFAAGANVNHAGGEYESGTINIYGTINAAVGPSQSDGQAYIRLGFNTQSLNTNGVTNVDNGTINLNSGGVLVTSRQIVSGGSFNTPELYTYGLNGVFNFNGGTLETDGTNSVADWLESTNSVAYIPSIAPLTAVTIGPLGAFINTEGVNATITYGMTPSNGVPDGGLTKQGLGTLTLAGANTYTGNTVVTAGELELVLPTLFVGSTVSIASGATLQLDFATTNTVGGLILNGVSQPVGVYNNTSSPTYITGTGSLQVTPYINPHPPVLGVSFSGNGVGGTVVNLSWPTNAGWILQTQTNGPGTGLSTNWVNVPGSSAVTTTNYTVNTTNGSVFYRLIYP